MFMRESVLDRESNLKHEKKKLHKKITTTGDEKC